MKNAMQKLIHIEVEPLSDQRWAKIERSLAARLELETLNHEGPPGRRSRPLGLRKWLVAAAVLGALAALVLAIRRLPEPATLENPSRITTGQSPSHLALPGLALDVEPHSAVVVSAETPQGVLVVLDRGSIVCHVAPRSSDAPLIVQAGAARVRVVGTRFRVTRMGESARVKVHQGVVEVTSAGESQRVRAGEEWPLDVVQRPISDPDSVSEPPSISDPDPSAEATSSISNAAPRDAEPAAPTRVATEKSVATDRPPLSSSTASEPRKSAAAAASASASASAGEGVPRRSSQAVFEQATALERSDPARAARLYRTLEAGAGSWAQNALYARGRLEASRGNPGEARRLLEQYLERFPRGSNAEDARAVLRRLR